MNIRHTRGVLVGTAILGSLLVAPQVAHASPLPAQDEAAACEVTDGTLSWGVKESFRSYISGTIANGSWETTEGAEYEIPNFIWGNANGSIDAETGVGSVSFTGTVHFTGHDGVLDLTLANPTIELDGEGKAALLADARSTDMEGEVAVDAEQEWVGEIELDGNVNPADGALEIADAPVALTNSGAGAFAGFYEAGVELDPLTLGVELDGCETDEAVAAPPTPEEPEPVAAASEAQEVPWIPIAIGGAALLAIGLTVGMLIGGRSRKASAPAAADSSL